MLKNSSSFLDAKENGYEYTVLDPWGDGPPPLSYISLPAASGSSFCSGIFLCKNDLPGHSIFYRKTKMVKKGISSPCRCDHSGCDHRFYRIYWQPCHRTDDITASENTSIRTNGRPYIRRLLLPV